MKLYIFLTTLIRGIGGGHIYTLNKIHYLTGLGWDTRFLHADVKAGRIVIEELRQYEKMGEQHLQRPPYMFSSTKQIHVLDKLVKLLDLKHTYDEIVIESQTIDCALWGELLAKRMRAKNFVFLLGELQRTKNEVVYDFWKYKLARKELYGIGKNSLKSLMTGWDVSSLCLDYSLSAYCSNSLADIEFKEMKALPKADYTIGMIGRIDKIFVEYSLDKILKFAQKHSDKRFLVVLIGGTTKQKKIKELKKKVESLKNIACYITGLIYPIPVELVRKPDVFISTSGSCNVSYNLGKITISCDIHDFQPIGILGITTKNIMSRSSDEPPLRLELLLEEILIDKKYREENKPFIPLKFDFSHHLEAIDRSSHQKEYFKFYTPHFHVREFVIWISTRILGIEVTNFLWGKIIKLFSKK